MFVLGLTGSIGMGKSTVAAMFARLGVPVHDADAAVHRLYGPGGAAVEAVRRLVPEAVVGEGRTARVDRGKLGQAVLGDRAKLAALEAAVHPLVGAERDRFLRHMCRRGESLVVMDVPLLYETGGERGVDAVAVVSAPAFLQARRVLARPGMTEEKLARIRARQTPDAVKRRRADHVVPTGCSKAETFRNVRRLVHDLRGRQGRIWPPR